MAERRGRRSRGSGAVRRLPSGRYQARLDVGVGHVSVGSFATRREADHALALARADQARGTWVDPRRARVAFGEYARRWLAERPGLRPRTVELYDSLLRIHLFPQLESRPLHDITPSVVRRWHASRLAAGTGQVSVAKAYRLLRTILGTAVQDELIVKNPCLLKGAGVERSPERPVASLAEVEKLADAVEPRYRALVLLATFTTLRFGELAALTRERLDLRAATVTVTEQVIELKDGRRLVGPPKTEAGTRIVSIPAAILPDIEAHLERFAAPGARGEVFCGPEGAPLRRQNWHVKWRTAVKAVGLDGLRFHDLRHTGNTLAASTGASTKELMARMGHASPRAALIYQHATREREDTIAAALSELITAGQSTRPTHNEESKHSSGS